MERGTALWYKYHEAVLFDLIERRPQYERKKER